MFFNLIFLINFSFQAKKQIMNKINTVKRLDKNLPKDINLKYVNMSTTSFKKSIDQPDSFLLSNSKLLQENYELKILNLVNKKYFLDVNNLLAMNFLHAKLFHNKVENTINLKITIFNMRRFLGLYNTMFNTVSKNQCYSKKILFGLLNSVYNDYFYISVINLKEYGIVKMFGPLFKNEYDKYKSYLIQFRNRTNSIKIKNVINCLCSDD
ncbi:hypothetical protein TUBRATIS_13810 [Tubulinosema ratisbonensis]|uniref:Uncharacterized protein n=1 Tax=Tubulinosema ratisbonensis TaxID=291195 RepID=A0A437AMC4_9MICR|nr:hypothetical protein TUBRATIS_13810 [Tubulinosema ratisbonensis]